MRNFVLKMINMRVSLPSFVWVLSSIILAVYILTHHTALAATPFGRHLVFGPLYWAVSLLVGDCLTLGGMLFRPNFPVVRIGSMISFSLWLFANIGIYTLYGWNLFLAWTIPIQLIYVYLWLAAAIGSFRKSHDIRKL